MTNYIVVTPAKNEIANLPLLAESMLSQIMKPTMWVIVDDWSTDGTTEYVRRLELTYDFIRHISSEFRDKNNDYCLDKYGKLVRTGIVNALEYCKVKNMECHYIAVVDADMYLTRGYFKELIKALEDDPKLGIVSGIIFDKYNNHRLVAHRDLRGNPVVTASAMLIRKKCLDSIGGFPIIIGPENVLMIKAKNRGWKIECIEYAIGIHNRPIPISLSATWRKFINSGETYYRLNYHPMNVILSTVYNTIQRTKEGLIDIRILISGLAYLTGYFASFISKKEKIQDIEVTKFYSASWNRLIKEIFTSLYSK